jgi:hypothetical protein
MVTFLLALEPEDMMTVLIGVGEGEFFFFF